MTSTPKETQNDTNNEFHNARILILHPDPLTILQSTKDT